MAVSTIGNVVHTEKRAVRGGGMKELNVVASFFGNQLFGNGKRRLYRCGSTGVGVIDFADVEEENEKNWGGLLRRKTSSNRGCNTLRSPRGVLQKMIPNNATQMMQMDLILLDESPRLKELQGCAWKGCCARNRAQVWRMLSGYEPLQYSQRAKRLEKKRKLYREYVKVLCAPEGESDLQLALHLKKYRWLGQGEEFKEKNRDVVEYSDYSVKTLRQIEMDLPRTHPEMEIFHTAEIRNAMRRILYLYGMLNPSNNYVQGMNELLTPILVVFVSSYLKETSDKGVEAFLGRKEIGGTVTGAELEEAEADAFWTFSSIVSCVEDNFVAEQPGILRRIGRLEEIIRIVDPVLWRHLEANGNEFIQFGYRWMNCLLMRELPFTMVVKLWDALMAEEDGMADLHVYFCAAMLTRFRAQLLSKGFEDCILFLQHLPTGEWKTDDVDELLSQAYVWKKALLLPSLAGAKW